MRGQTTEATMQHDYLTAEFSQARTAPLTHDGQPIALGLHLVTERDLAYFYALRWIDDLEPLNCGRGYGRVNRYYRNRAGILLETLGEVVEAVLAGELAEAAQ